MTVEEKKAAYLIMWKGMLTDYTLIKRNTEYCPFIVAWGFNEEDYTWGQGHYFNDYSSALWFLLDKEKEAIEEKMEEIGDDIEI